MKQVKPHLPMPLLNLRLGSNAGLMVTLRWRRRVSTLSRCRPSIEPVRVCDPSQLGDCLSLHAQQFVLPSAWHTRKQ